MLEGITAINVRESLYKGLPFYVSRSPKLSNLASEVLALALGAHADLYGG